MVSEGVASSSIVVIVRVVHILSVCLCVRITVDRVVGIVGEEQAIPCPVLFVLSELLVSVSLIVCLEHSLLSDVKFLLGDHGGEGLEVGASEPGILHHSGVSSVGGEQVPTGKADAEEEEFKGLASEVALVDVMADKLKGM